MKTNILTILALIVSIQLNAQEKGDNTIFISEDIPIKKIKEVLFHNGYSFEAYEDTAFLFTKQKFLEESLAGISVKLLFFKSTEGLFIRGLSKMTGSDADRSAEFKTIEFAKFLGKKVLDWVELQKIAKAISPNYSYLKKPDDKNNEN